MAERAETTGFTSKLRGELERAKFAGASQVDLDRVFELAFEGGVKRKLVVELMPPGNIVLVDEEGRITLALDEVRSKSRRVLRGKDMSRRGRADSARPKSESKTCRSMWMEEKTAGRALGRHIGLPRKYVAESLALLGLTDESPSSSLQGREAELVDVLRRLVNEARDNPRPCICKLQGGEDVFVIPPKGAEVVASAESVSELCDKLFLSEARSEEVPLSQEQEKKKELEITISKLRTESATLLADASRARSAASAGSAPVEEALEGPPEAGVVSPLAKGASSIASLLFDHAKELEHRSAEGLEAARELRKKLGKIRPSGLSPNETSPKGNRNGSRGSGGSTPAEGGSQSVAGTPSRTPFSWSATWTTTDVVYHADLLGSPVLHSKGGARPD